MPAILLHAHDHGVKSLKNTCLICCNKHLVADCTPES